MPPGDALGRLALVHGRDFVVQDEAGAAGLDRGADRVLAHLLLDVLALDLHVKILVGKIATEKNDSLPGKTLKVAVSAADEDLIGKGYGTKMYLSVIQSVDYLLSDTTLFTGAYRMWKHILPKYVNVWGVDYGVISKYTRIRPGITKNVRKYDYFVASTKNNI